MLFKDLKGNYWQRFVYENLGGVYFWCGQFHASRELCPEGEDDERFPARLRSDNVVRVGGKEGPVMMVDDI